VPSRQLLTGKWIAAAAFAVGGLALNLAGFTAVFEWSDINPSATLIVPLLVWIVCGLVPAALLGAALLLLTGASSRTLKDAQARLSIVAMAPMMTSMFVVFFPGATGRWWMAVPVIGQQALIGEALRGHAVSPLQASVLASMTLMATATVLLLAGRAMNRNEITAS
jgi:ABC-type Na+ efflux pump permease subunit